ncbi:LysR family transcriptional regulator [Agrobacterium tumefaciens]|nr:LysR family transcriptional regulator [Agrobacterium tumefaciens]
MRRRKASNKHLMRQDPDWFGPRIPLVSLRHTLAVAELLNFRHAANVLGTTQSSVSTRIKALEETLGVLLFERRHRGVRLTEAGRRFAAEVSVGIDHLDHAIQMAGALAVGVEGKLAIGLHTSIASGFLTDLRQRYRSAYPGIEQIITERKSVETISLVRDGKLDVAFVVNTPAPPDCHSRDLWREPIVAALAADHPLAVATCVTWDDLATEVFLARQGASGPQMFDHVVRRVTERGQIPKVQRCDVGRDTLMHLVASDDGITLTTEAASGVPFPGIAFRPIADETEQARFSAIWSPHNRNAALRNLLDLAADMAKSARSG